MPPRMKLILKISFAVVCCNFFAPYLPTFSLPLAQAETIAQQAEGNGGTDLAEFARTVQLYDRARLQNPNSAASKKLAALVDERAKRILSNSAAEMTRLLNQQPRVKDFSARWAEVEETVKAMSDLRGRYSLPFRVLKNPELPPTPDNIATGVFEAAAASPEDVAKDSPRNLKERMARYAAIGGKGALEFTNQYVAFSIATGMLTVAQLGADYGGNPVSVDDLMKSLKSVDGGVQFGIFMATNHLVAKLLSGVHAKVLPRWMVPQIGMVAGFLASSLFYDLKSDQNVQICISSRLMAVKLPGFRINEQACDAAFDTWAVHNKIIEYMPRIISLTSAAILTGETRNAIGRMGRTETFKVFLKGARLARAADAFAISAAGGFTPPAVAVAVGEFVIFLAYQKLIEPTVNSQWSAFQVSTLNVKTTLDQYGLHREFLFPKDFSRPPIVNAFDVDATDLPSAHGRMMTFIANMDQSGWQPPSPTSECTKGKLFIKPPFQPFTLLADWAFSRFFQNGDLSLMASPLGLAAGTMAYSAQVGMNSLNRKTPQELKCETLSQPLSLIVRYGKMQFTWRQLRNAHFEEAFYNWMRLIGRFADQYVAAEKLFTFLTKAKYAEVHGQAKRPDLSKQALNREIGRSAGMVNLAQALPPTSLGIVPTPTMVDYVIAGFACGIPRARSGLPADAGLGGSLLAKMREKFERLHSGQSFVVTPYGSSFQFVPPNLTAEGGEICLRTFAPRGLALIPPVALTQLGGDLIRQEMRSPRRELQIFSGEWRDSGSRERPPRVYENLADFVYDNLDPSIYDSSVGATDSSTWWLKNVASKINSVWLGYTEKFNEFVNKKFLPVVKDESFKTGCAPPFKMAFAKQSVTRRETDEWGFVPLEGRASSGSAISGEYACSDPAWSLRIANGLLSSINVELRTYMRALHSIYLNLHDVKDRPQARLRFLAKANALLRAAESGSNLGERADRSGKAASELIALFTDNRTFLPKGQVQNADYKAVMFATFALQTAKILDEIRSHADLAGAMNIDRYNSRPAVKTEDNKVHMGPLTR